MANLTYPLIIERDRKYTAIADLAARFQKIDKVLIMSNIVELVPKEFLILLAEKWSVLGNDGWRFAESEDSKRNLIKHSVEMHRHKGTPWSIKEVIRRLGLGEIEIIEGLFGRQHDGSIFRDGVFYHGDKNKWAYYRIMLKRAITNDQAKMIRDVLREYAPARCVLAGLDYREVSIRHNGIAFRGGNYNRGEA